MACVPEIIQLGLQTLSRGPLSLSRPPPQQCCGPFRRFPVGRCFYYGRAEKQRNQIRDIFKVPLIISLKAESLKHLSGNLYMYVIPDSMQSFIPYIMKNLFFPVLHSLWMGHQYNVKSTADLKFDRLIHFIHDALAFHK